MSEIPEKHMSISHGCVSIDDFLKFFPKATNDDKEGFMNLLDRLGIVEVEKRIHHNLIRGLKKQCLSTMTLYAEYTPIVTHDGWVFWLYGRHEDVLEYLCTLYTGKTNEFSETFLVDGLGWYISTVNCKTIMLSEKYIPNNEDREIFSFFKLEYIDIFFT